MSIRNWRTTSYRIQGRPLLRFSTKRNPELEAFNKSLVERSGGKTPLVK